MPIFEYKCKRCQRVHEDIVLSPTSPPAQCPTESCDGEQEKLIGLIHWKHKYVPRIRTEADVIAEKGPDWRQTKASRRIRNGEPERLYSHGGINIPKKG